MAQKIAFSNGTHYFGIDVFQQITHFFLDKWLKLSTKSYKYIKFEDVLVHKFFNSDAEMTKIIILKAKVGYPPLKPANLPTCEG